MTGSKATDWTDLSRRAALASHRLIGWVYWDPTGIANYAELGVPEGAGYYVATRAASLAGGGNAAVTAAFGSIHPDFVAGCLDLCRAHTTFDDAAAARDRAVVHGLRTFVPEVCHGLGSLATPLWDAADALPMAGRVLAASLRQQIRPGDPLLSAWLAVNCIREWRGDTHWAINVAEGLDGEMAGVLDGAWRNYDGHWLPRSRGTDDGALEAALIRLADRGLAEGDTVNATGIAYRQGLEDRLDRLTEAAWRDLGLGSTLALLALLEPVGPRLVDRIDQTAGPRWMPAARDRKAPL